MIGPGNRDETREKDSMSAPSRTAVFLTLALWSHLACAQVDERITIAKSAPPALNNVHFSGHSMLLNPKFIDAEISGGIRFKNLLDSGGFLSYVPHSRGFGGTHYGEIRTAARLVKIRSFTFGPAHEHVTLTHVKDYEKLGIGGTFKIRKATFDYEAYAYSTNGKRNNLGMFYNIPLPYGWTFKGFTDYLVFAPKRPVVSKATLHRKLPAKFEFLIEYFHNDSARPAERNKLGAGVGYKLK